MSNPPERLANRALLDEFLRLERAGLAARTEVWQEMEARYGDSIYPRVIYLLTRKQFSLEEARRHWRNILAHSRDMSQALGREVGVRTAMCDYFINVAHLVEEPLLVEGHTLRQKEASAFRDELTGLYNRRFFNSALHKQVAEARRYEQTFSLIMMDVDHFKGYNDRNGHLAGDRALAEVAGLLASTTRKVDYLVRFGGEEFAVILPRSSREEALIAAERYRQAVERHPFPGEETLPGGKLTICAGVACFPIDARNALDLIHRADMALYAAKRQGRNRVAASGPERRRSPRVEYVAPVECRPAWDKQDFFTGETRDISTVGVRLAASRPVERDQPLDLVIHAGEDGLVVKVQGRAVHVHYSPRQPHPYTLGIRLEGEESGAPSGPLAALVERRLETMH